MRHLALLLLTSALPQLLAAQTASQNYILSRRPLNTAGTAAIETVTYVDGLGRPVETVQKGAAPDGGDIVSMKEYDGIDREVRSFSMKEYDGIDREVRSWLPVPVGKGGGGYVPPQTFKSSAVGSDIYGGDVSPYSENVYEQSALGRIVRRQGPGKAWPYSFTDKPLLRRHVYTAAGSPLTEEYTYAYDHADRLVSTRLALNGGESCLLSYVSYDGIGRPCTTTLGNGTTVSSAYNVRSWLKSVSSPVFSERLSYESPGTSAQPRYGGSVSRIDWRATDGRQTLDQAFVNRYDGLNRLENVDYTRNGTSYNKFATYAYDSMGNIRRLSRKGRFDSGSIGLIDDLMYEYDGNHYYVKDHLGSNRVVLADNGTVEQVNDYYPFGALMSNGWTNVSSQKYKYIGKELDRMFGLNWQRHFFRFYDNILAKWPVMDRLAEKYAWLSPYCSFKDNPFHLIDFNGDSLTVASNMIDALYNGLNQNSQLVFHNGVLDPQSISINDETDSFAQDLYEIAVNQQMVELTMANDVSYLINGIKESTSFTEPYDDVDEFNPVYAPPGEYGKHINGNLGQSLFPIKSPISGKQSTNNKIQIMVNGRGSLNHRTVGAAHEFGHVILYLRGLPYSHFQNGVDSFINDRTSRMSKKLGYDY